MAVVEEVKAIDLEKCKLRKKIDEAVAKLNKAVDALEEKVVIEPEKPSVPEKPSEKPSEKPTEKPTENQLKNQLQNQKIRRMILLRQVILL